MEYAIVVVLVAAASMGMMIYMGRALSGQYRSTGDSFGHGRQYGRCLPTERFCWAVTVRGHYGADTWDKDMPDLCKDDPCDPATHCTALAGPFGTGRVCATVTGYGSSAATARSDATAQVNTACPSAGGGCPTACQFDGTTFLGAAGIKRQKGVTGHLCVNEINAVQTCSAGCPKS